MTPAKKKAAPRKREASKRVTPKAVAPVKLDIACGQRKGGADPTTGLQDPTGWTGIDIAATEAVDIVHDLNVYPWPIEDQSVDMARCSHYIEHIPHDIPGSPLDGFIAFGNELHRILKPGAQCEIIAPYDSSTRAWQDPTHRRAISEQSFFYWNQEWLAANGLDHYGVTADFDFGWGYHVPDPMWQTAHEEKRQFAMLHYRNVISDIFVTLTRR